MKKRIGLFCLIVVMLLVTGCGINENKTQHKAFDYYVECTTMEDIETLSQKAFVESVFSFTLLTFQRPGYDSSMMGQIAYLAVPSFDELNTSPFNSDRLIAEDTSIMQSEDLHPILISESLAKAENLSVGDSFYQECKVSDVPLEFTVAGIYRHEPIYAQFEAVILISEQILTVFSDKVDELGYTNAYIKSTDEGQLKSYLDTEFVPHLVVKGMSKEEIVAIPREELTVYYADYVTHVTQMK
ncbi:MAG: hypothetical protein IJD85_06800 [Oscillospiraceae bacterium]|nr:hypothetical protein [Oscillospiraceae bacterium]